MNRYQVSDHRASKAGVAFTWGDGHESFYHALWLRLQCYCATCGNSLDGLRDVWLEDLTDEPAMADVQLHEEALAIRWLDDDHLSTYPLNWLRDNAYEVAELQQRQRRPILWGEGTLPTPCWYDLEQVLTDATRRLELFYTVRDLGFALLHNVATTIDGIEQATSLFGPMRQTHYGISEIIEKPEQANVGDSGRALRPHTDEAYRIHTVGITILQMVNPGDRGGTSILVDGFNAAKQLARTDPAGFRLLCDQPVNFHRLHTATTHDHRDRYLVSRAPVIRLDEWGELSGIRINERQMGPLGIAPERTVQYYATLRKLFAQVYRAQNQLHFPLAAGEAIIFDNQRILHGRTAFPRSKALRHVRTCTVDTEEFHSSLRLLQMQRGLPCNDFMPLGS